MARILSWPDLGFPPRLIQPAYTPILPGNIYHTPRQAILNLTKQNTKAGIQE